MRSPTVAVLLLLMGQGCMPETRSSNEGEVPDLLPSLQATSSADSVVFVFQITNTTEDPIALEYSSGQSFDFVVTDAGGAEIWR